MPQLDPIPFAIPDISEREVAAAAERIRSGWLTTGPTARQFESDFLDFLRCGVGNPEENIHPEEKPQEEPALQAISVNSATAGLHLALEAVGIGPGDDVLVPDWTFTSTAEVVRYLGANPVLVDVDPTTLNIDFSAAQRALTPRTRAIMPVHFAGLAVDRTQLATFATRHQLSVVEDAAHALPATNAGRMVGTWGSDAVVYSFYATKTITTGEGGMVVTHRPELAERMRTMRLHGISRDVFDRYTSTRPAWEYDVVSPGYKYNLTDIAAAIGRVQLTRAWDMRRRREEIAHAYHRAFADLPVQLPADAPAGQTHAWHLYVLRMLPESPISRDDLIEYLSQAQIGTSVHFIPLHRHSYWAQYCLQGEAQLPVASANADRAMSLPLFSALTDAQVDRIITTVRGAFGA